MMATNPESSTISNLVMTDPEILVIGQTDGTAETPATAQLTAMKTSVSPRVFESLDSFVKTRLEKRKEKGSALKPTMKAASAVGSETTTTVGLETTIADSKAPPLTALFKCNLCQFSCKLQSEIISHCQVHSNTNGSSEAATSTEPSSSSNGASVSDEKATTAQPGTFVISHYQCKFCKFNCKTIPEMEIHIAYHPKEEGQTKSESQTNPKIAISNPKKDEILLFECKMCGFTSDFPGAIKSHCRSYHKISLLYHTVIRRPPLKQPKNWGWTKKKAKSKVTKAITSSEESSPVSCLVSVVDPYIIKLADGINSLYTSFSFERECNFCKKEFNSKSELLVHESCYLNKRKMRELFLDPPEKDFDCEMCGAGFDTLDDLKIHANTHFEPLFKCKVCNFTSDIEIDMCTHSETHSGVFSCMFPQCDLNKAYGDMKQVSDHIIQTHFPNFNFSFVGPKPECLGPEPEIESATRGDDRTRETRGVEKFITKKFHRSSYSDMYEEHFDLVCKLCQVNFTSIAGWMTHEPCFEKKRELNGSDGKVHPVLNSFLCEICNRPRFSLEELCEHASSHKIPKIFKCNQCEHSENTEEGAIDHTQEHTGELIWKCSYPECNSEKGFKQSVHVLVHIKNKHFTRKKSDLNWCRLKRCHKKFATIKDRKVHESLNHPNAFMRLEMKLNRIRRGRNLKPSRSYESPVTLEEFEYWKGLMTPNTTKLGKPRKPVSVPSDIVVPSFEGDADTISKLYHDWAKQFVKKLEKPKREGGMTWRHLPFQDTCKMCNQTWTSKATFLVHDPCYYVKRSRQLMEDGVEEAPRYQCDVCNESFNNLDRLRCHMSYHVDPEIVCIADGCGKLFHNDFQARSHYNTHHAKHKIYECAIDPGRCKQTSKTFVSACRHIVTRHLNVTPYVCTEKKCGCTFVSLREMNRHIRNNHTERTRVVCPVLDCRYPQIAKEYVLNHFKNSHPTFDTDKWLEENPQFKKVERVKRVEGKLDIVNGETVIVDPPKTSTQVLESGNDKDEKMDCTDEEEEMETENDEDEEAKITLIEICEEEEGKS